KCKPDCATAIDAGGRALANHADCDFAQHEVGRLRPGRLKQAKDWHSMGWHEYSLLSSGDDGYRLSTLSFRPATALLAPRIRFVAERLQPRADSPTAGAMTTFHASL